MMRALLDPEDWLGRHQAACLALLAILIVAADSITAVL
jgi:hypothetical protein